MKKTVWALLAVVALGSGAWLYQWSRVDFETLDGQSHRWRDLQGSWVVVNYFAEWCAPCLKEIPELNGFAEYSEKNENLALFAVSYDPLSKDELQQLKQKYAMDFALIASPTPTLPIERPKSLPATYIISPDGTVLKRLLGEQSNESLQQIIESLQRL